MKKRIAVLVSGGGTNLQALIDNTENKHINGEIVTVISNRKKAYGLERASNHHIEAKYIGKGNYPVESERMIALEEYLELKKVDIIVLAGYLSILSGNIISRYKNAIINIHPSLIPKHCGPGFYGIKVHQSVLDHKESESGATVHFVDEGVDTGEIIVQKKVRVYEDDTAETLAKRVLAVEHKILVATIKDICK